MRREFPCLLCLLLLSSNLFSQAQELSPGVNKNAVYGTMGLGLAYGTLMANYERIVFQRPSISFGARIAAGSWGNFKDKGIDYLGSVYGLTGGRNNHFEFGLGMNIRDQRADTTSIFPAFNMGYRFHKPGGIFIFRTGVGWPEGLFLSVGVSF